MRIDAETDAGMRAPSGDEGAPYLRGADFSRAGGFWRNLAVWLLAFTFLIAWLPFVRALIDGRSYQWATQIFAMRFSGAGTDGDFWFAAAQAAIALAIVALGFRGAGRIFYLLALFWSGLMAAHYLVGLVAAPGELVFRGDTLGVEIDIGLSAFTVYGIAFLSALTGARMEYARGMRPPRFPWTPANTILFALALLIVPFQVFLLREGEAHGRTDELGVILTMVQWVVLVLAFAMNRSRAR